MTRPGWLAAALAVAAVSVALPFARTPAAPAHPVPTVSFSAMGLSFRYPAAWRHVRGFPGFRLPRPNATIGGRPAVETKARKPSSPPCSPRSG